MFTHCLKTSNTLRKQLFSTFGSAALFSLALVVITSCFSVWSAGGIVKTHSSALMEFHVRDALEKSSRLMAEKLNARLSQVDSSVQLLVESVQDRIVGYPNLEGWEDGNFVPFIDSETETRKYPLAMPPVSFDWNVSCVTMPTSTQNGSHFREDDHNSPNQPSHTADGYFHGPTAESGNGNDRQTTDAKYNRTRKQLGEERLAYFEVISRTVRLSMDEASYHFRGSCDPNVDPKSSDWVDGCLEWPMRDGETVGGIFRPPQTHTGLYQSTGDISVFMKPLFESRLDALRINVYFVNNGAGATLSYPAGRLPSIAHSDDENGNNGFYISNGCEWMTKINNRTGKPYGTTDSCHKKGGKVPFSQYNPLEEEWAPFYLQQIDKVGWFSPPCADEIVDSSDEHNAHQPDKNMKICNNHQILKAGKAILDRLTGELIGFVTIDIALQSFQDSLEDAAAWSDTSEVYIIRQTDGQVLESRIPNGHKQKEHSQETNKKLLKMAGPGALFEYDNHFITAHPLTAAPHKAYHNDGDAKDYVGHPDLLIPQYYVLLSIPTHAVPLKEETNAAIDYDVRKNIITSIILFLVGCLTFFIILGGVSAALTDPLLWIEDVAHRINQGTQRRITLDGDLSSKIAKIRAVRYAPKTEVFFLVKEFQSVLSGLSGKGVSRVASSVPNSMKNALTYNEECESFYAVSESEMQLHSFDPSIARDNGMQKENSKSRFTQPVTKDGRPIEVPRTPEANPTLSTTTVLRKIKKYPNPGPVVNESLLAVKPVRENQNSKTIWRSALFRWIVILIIIPLVLTNAVLVALVAYSTTTDIPQWINMAETKSEGIVRQNLRLIATSKASVISSVVGGAIRDLHFLSRVIGWLFFEGITRSDAFTKGRFGSAETCKRYSANSPIICPVFKEIPCSCDWENPWPEKPWPGCSNFTNETDSRFLQEFHVSAQSLDANNETGNRLSTPSFPEMGYSSDTTYWWSNTSDVPGAHKGANASGHWTTYDRIRVSSAASVVYFPIYNYATNLGNKKPILGTYMGFEKDGMMHGADGCYGFDGEVPNVRSSNENRAEEIAPDLCPMGKYGYDPRCRSWYDTGKRMYKEGQVPVHVTSPYSFQTTIETIASAATAPIANPKTDEYIGQILLDFFPLGLRESMTNVKETLSFVITPEKDITGGDTVIGPNKTEGWKSESISNALFPSKGVGEVNEGCLNFETKILKRMKEGLSDIGEFRLGNDESSTDLYILAFAPVTYRLLLPTDPSEFSEGVEVSSDVVYSVGIGESRSIIKVPFYKAYEQMNKELITGPLKLSIAVIGVVTLLFVIFTIYVAMKVTAPIVTLLKIVRDINRGIFSEDIPPLEGGCKESMQVYSIFSRLNKLVMVSNTAFFSHKMEKAQHFLNTALKLFRKIDDEKAIGIASNNLANTLFATLYTESLATAKPLVCSNPEFLDQALEHYEKAVNIAQFEFESAPLKEKSIFAERLGDRLFNRGMFLIFCSRYASAPPGSKEEGYGNIQQVRTLHYELRDYLLEKKLLWEQSASYWNRLIRRINCLLAFHDDAELRTIWDAENLLDEADELMMAMWQVPSAPLFKDVTPTGRRQQLEGAGIILCHQIGQNDQAYHLAMRMFAQDEYLLESCFVPAAETLLAIAEADNIFLSTKLQDELKIMLNNRSRNPMEFLTMETF